jgi:hypothetical protein
MARIRTIKPEFFTSEDVIELSPLARLLYIAIWCEADREGRLAWKPKTLKIRYLPADNCDIKKLCSEIIERGLVKLYGNGFACIPSFHKHQHINPREAASTLPEPPRDDDASSTSQAPVSDAPPRDSDAPPRDSDAQVGKEGKESNDASLTRTCDEDDSPGFSECWSAYPKREGGNSRKEAEKAYRARLRAGVSPAELLAGVQRYALFVRAKGQEGTSYVKQASTFLGAGEHWRELWEVAEATGTPSGDAERASIFAGAL